METEPKSVVKPLKYSRLTTQKINRILLYFCEDITAVTTAKLTGVNRKTVDRYYNEIREKILKASLREAVKTRGEFEADESYFGAKRVRGKRGRGAAIPGATAATYTPVDAGSYTVTASAAGYQSKTSAAVAVTAPGGTPALSGDVTISPDSGVTTGTALTASYSGSETVTWQWNKGGAAIPGATAAAYTPGETGSYTVTASAAGFQSKTSAAVTVTERVYAIGDTGPGGGKIFYVSEAGFGPGSAWHYLEAAPADIGENVWATYGTTYDTAVIPDNGATGTDIGTGKANTAAIVAAAGANAPAAKHCDDYTYGDKYDWFLPSKDELHELYTNKAHIDSPPTSNSYWSSSEYTSNHAWRQNFSEDNQGAYPKHSTYAVRAVRAF